MIEQHKYERIDKGMKRSKAKLPKAEKPKPVNNHGALAEVDNDALIARIAAGEYVSHMAREFGVSDVALHLRLKGHPLYKEALRARNAAKLDQHQSGIEVARDPLSLARAREGWKAASWRAERECPGEWGQQTHVTIENVTDLGDRLRRSKERTIEGECSQVATIPATLDSQVPDK